MSPAAQHGAILGLDPGERRIGVALAISRGGPSGGPTGGMALPLTVIDRTGDWLEHLAALAEEHGATEVVVGLPVSLKGTEGRAAELARSFAGEVEARLGLPVHLVDERLSTVAAGRALAAGGAGSRRRRSVVDRSAAAMILQTYLDSQAGREAFGAC